MEEIKQGKGIVEEIKPQITKAKKMSDEERINLATQVVKKFDYYNKLKVISTLVVLKLKRKSPEEKQEFMQHIYEIIDVFKGFEKRKFMGFCKGSIREIKEKDKPVDEDKENLDTFKKILRYVENGKDKNRKT